MPENRQRGKAGAGLHESTIGGADTDPQNTYKINRDGILYDGSERPASFV